MTKIPKIAIVGRTNVGKSTLFNRLAETQKALVSKIPGTTRDRNEADCIWRAKLIRVIDTGGLEAKSADDLDKEIAKQSRMAIQNASVIVFVVDATQGLNMQDRALANELVKMKKPVIAVANKAESASSRKSQGTWRWPFGDPLFISALIGSGVGDLLDEIYTKLEEAGTPAAEITEVVATRVAIIGKPNVGKSSFLNAVLGEERFIVNPVAHTTREPNDTLVEYGEKQYILIDTAGLRKISAKQIKKMALESAAMKRVNSIIDKADVTILILDSNERVTDQDKAIAGMLVRERAGIIIAANKWDLITDKTPTTINKFTKYIRASLPHLSFAPIVFVSAKTGQRVQGIFELIDKVQQARFVKIEQEELDAFFEKTIKQHLPARGKGPGFPKIYGFTQTKIAPPTFELTIRGTRADALHPSYLRYLENRLREEFNFPGTPINIKVKTSH